MSFFKKNKIIILLLLILSIATFFRVWQINLTPPGLYPDEAINGNDAIQTLESGQFKMFYPENNGREGLFVWLIALIFKIFGASAWALRLTSAIIGTLTVLGIYLLTKELFSKKVALASAFLLSVSFWHINFSRIGFRAILVPFLICFSFYFLLRAFRKNNILNYIWAGIFFGLGFYTYIAFRAAVIVLGILTLFKIKWSRLWKIGLFSLTILITVLPIGIHFINNPQDFTGRASGISVLSGPSPLKAISVSAVQTLGMFNFVGDHNWRHNLAGAPTLFPLTGFLFLVGLILTLLNPKRLTNIFLLSWFAVMLLPAILTNEGIPHSLRTIGVIPVVYIFAALGLVWLFEQIAERNKKIAFAVLTAFLILAPAATFHKYFYQWAKNPNTAAAFRQDLTELTARLANLPNNVQKYIIANAPGVPVPFPNGLPMPAQTIIFESKVKNLQIKYLVPDNGSYVNFNNQQAVIVLLKYDENILNQLSNNLPKGKIIKINEFYAYEIK